MAAKESAIRDALANNLELLEPGLTLIAVEHPVPNTEGTKGFIDILARDSMGNRVVIELKRSNRTARDAIHEIFKYVTLFQSQNGLPDHKIRCFIVSTEWDELRVPFSTLAALAHFQLAGFLISTDHSGAVLRAEQQEPLKLSEPIDVFRDHSAYLFEKAASRDRALGILGNAFVAAGGTAGFIISMEADFPKRIVYPFAAYLVPGAIAPEVRAEIEACLRSDDPTLNDDHFQNMEGKVQVEEHFAARVMERADQIWDSFEIGYPEKFDAMLHAGWHVKTISRLGGAPTMAGADDQQVLVWIRGLEGDNAHKFQRITSPKLHLDWANSKEQMLYCLTGNEEWKLACQHFFQTIERDNPQATVAVSIYNPLCLPVSLFKLLVGRDADYLSALEILMHDAASGKMAFLLGRIEWDGTTFPHSLDAVFRDKLRSFSDYMFAVGIHASWEFDHEVLVRHGLNYATARIESAGQEFVVTPVDFAAQNGEIVMSERESSRLPIYEFVRANPAYLHELVRAVAAGSIGL